MTRWFGDLELGLLWGGIRVFGCDGGDGNRYVSIVVTLDRVIAARRSPRIILTLTVLGHVLPSYIYIVY